MERSWSRAVATSGNRWQTERVENPLKEGADGSSPSEGFGKNLQIRKFPGFLLPVRVRSLLLRELQGTIGIGDAPVGEIEVRGQASASEPLEVLTIPCPSRLEEDDSPVLRPPVGQLLEVRARRG
jgi:hypothetical protein